MLIKIHPSEALTAYILNLIFPIELRGRAEEESEVITEHYEPLFYRFFVIMFWIIFTKCKLLNMISQKT